MKNDGMSIQVARSIRCGQIETLLDDYVEGSLTELQKSRVDSHIFECSACRELVRDCRMIVEVAKSLDETPIPSDVSQRLRESLRSAGFNPHKKDPFA